MANDPEVVITLMFNNYNMNHAEPPTYYVTKSNTIGDIYQDGNLDFLFKEIKDVKITFKIDPSHTQDIEFVAGGINNNEFYSIAQKNWLLPPSAPTDFAKKITSDAPKSQFKCNQDCKTDTGKWQIVTTYDNTIATGFYTSYGLRYKTKETTGWMERWTPDPGVKNGGVSLMGVLIAVALLGGGALLVRQLLKFIARNASQTEG